MKAFLLIALLFNITFSFSQSHEKMFNENVQVTKIKNKIYLEGRDCALLNKEGAALEAWTKSIKERSVNKNCTCSKGVCRKEVTATLPEFVEAYQFKHVPTDGPNCWNATLVAAKLVPQVRYTSDFEMNFWMNSPLCKERKPNEKLSPGDIIAIRDNEVGEIHGFVHVSDNLSFSKNGYSKSTPYSLQDPDKVFDIYNVPKECRRRTGTPEDCPVYANYFSCRSVDDYLKENPIKEKVARDAYKHLYNFECEISEAVLGGNANGTELRSLVGVNVLAIKSLAYQVLVEGDYEPEDKVVWQAMYHKSQALFDQLKMIP